MEIQGLLPKDQSNIGELAHRTAALAEVFSAQSLLLSQCTQEAAVAKLETIDLSEALKEVAQEIEKRHKGAKEENRRPRKTSGSLETKCEDSRPTPDCSFDQRVSWGDMRVLVGEPGERQADVSFVIREEEEQPYRLETDTSLVETLQADESVGTVVHTEPTLPTHPVSPLVGKTALSRLARVKNKESSAIEQSFKRRSSTLWRL